MKRGKRPTRKQKELIQSAGLNYENWLVSKYANGRIVLVHRYTGTVREIAV